MMAERLSSTLLKRQKNDAAGAAAIGEAALQPNMHCVALKSAEHQARAVAFRHTNISSGNARSRSTRARQGQHGRPTPSVAACVAISRTSPLRYAAA